MTLRFGKWLASQSEGLLDQFFFSESFLFLMGKLMPLLPFIDEIIGRINNECSEISLFAHEHQTGAESLASNSLGTFPESRLASNRDRKFMVSIKLRPTFGLGIASRRSFKAWRFWPKFEIRRRRSAKKAGFGLLDEGWKRGCFEERCAGWKGLVGSSIYLCTIARLIRFADLLKSCARFYWPE